MNKKITIILFLAAILIIPLMNAGCIRLGANDAERGLTLAVEYNTHAACAFVAQDKGWMEEKGYDEKQGAFDVYATGVALAGALNKGGIDAAYICLIPAITAYANADVPIKVACGTHKDGYALIANPSVINNIEDLQRDGVKIGCVREGAPADIVLYRIIEHYELEKEKVQSNVLRMNPARQMMALCAENLHAAVVPEHFATLAVNNNQDLELLVKSQDVWPQLQGSVLVVTEKLFQENPAAVNDLLEITSTATDYINESPAKASEIVSDNLNAFRGAVDLKDIAADRNHDFEVTAEVVFCSMSNLDYTTSIERAAVQEIIDLMFELGYIKEKFPASDILLDSSGYEEE